MLSGSKGAPNLPSSHHAHLCKLGCTLLMVHIRELGLLHTLFLLSLTHILPVKMSNTLFLQQIRVLALLLAASSGDFFVLR